QHIQGLLDTWGITQDEFIEVFGQENRTLLLGRRRGEYNNQSIIVENFPLSILNFGIGGHYVIENWLAWRDNRSINRDFTDDDWEEFQSLVVNISCLMLLSPSIDEHFTNCCNDALEWNFE
ncbi:MAG: hypothetical protein QF722_03890, partial [Candidatus Thalassarchaeaceae archaeon]|nr:hypothetical protein [Candidatus Thalassarchaeaceae archaeon]